MDTLIIDDDPTGIFLTTRLLRREGKPADVVTAFVSPAEAVAFLQQQGPTDAPPDVVLLDLNMPLLSGWDVLDALQPLEAHLLGRCVVYVLTSSLAPADAARARQYPLVAGFLHKPLDGAEIQAMQAQLRETRPL